MLYRNALLEDLNFCHMPSLPRKVPKSRIIEFGSNEYQFSEVHLKIFKFTIDNYLI